MAFTSWIINQTPASGGESLYNLKEMLKSAGWTVNGWSDGTNYLNNSAGVDGVTSGSSGSGGFNNNGAWIRLTAPSNIELCIQRSATGEAFAYIVYSASAGFVSAGASATTAPNAADGVAIVNGQFFDSGGSYYMQGGADDSNGYGFWMACYNFSQQIRVGFVMEPLLYTDPNDVAPGKQNLFYATGPSGDAYSYSHLSNQNGYCASYLGDNYWTIVPGNVYRNEMGTVFPGSASSNPYSNTDDRIPIVYAKTNASGYPYGYKGQSRFMMWEGNTRSCADTKQNKTRIVFGNISLPWDGSTTPNI